MYVRKGRGGPIKDIFIMLDLQGCLPYERSVPERNVIRLLQQQKKFAFTTLLLKPYDCHYIRNSGALCGPPPEPSYPTIVLWCNAGLLEVDAAHSRDCTSACDGSM